MTTVTRLSSASPYARCSLCPGFAIVWADRALHTTHITPPAPAPLPAPAYAFADDFTAPTLDLAKWTRETHDAYGQGVITSDPKLTYVDPATGHLVQVCRKINGVWTSGQLSTRGTWARQPGDSVYIEVRAKLPATPGTWPGLIWASNDAFGSAGGQRAELDMVEQFYGGSWGSQPWLVASAHDWVHVISPGNSRKIQADYHGPVVDGAFHTFGTKWDPGRVELFLDGVSRGVLTKAAMEAAGGTWNLDDQPMYLLTQLCMMGNGRPDTNYPGPAADVTEARVEIDYVRVTAA